MDTRTQKTQDQVLAELAQTGPRLSREKEEAEAQLRETCATHEISYWEKLRADTEEREGREVQTLQANQKPVDTVDDLRAKYWPQYQRRGVSKEHFEMIHLPRILDREIEKHSQGQSVSSPIKGRF